MQQEYETIVRSSTIFAKVKPDTVEELFRCAQFVKYPKNRQIYSQDDRSTDFHIIIDGSVRAKSYSPDGKEVTYNDIGTSEVFGEFAALDESPRSATVIATTNVKALKLPSKFLNWAVENDGSVASALLLLQVEKIRTLTERVYEFSVLAVRQRVQTEIIRIAMADGIRMDDQIKITIPTHQELANRISTHREAITRELKFLVSQDLIRMNRREVLIRDINTFSQFAGNLVAGKV